MLSTQQQNELDGLAAKKRVALLTSREQQRYAELLALAAGRRLDVEYRTTKPNRKPLK